MIEACNPANEWDQYTVFTSVAEDLQGAHDQTGITMTLMTSANG